MRILGIALFCGFPLAAALGATNSFTVTNSGTTDYLIDGQPDPTVPLFRGTTYTFNLSAPGHPFWIKSIQGNGTGNAYTNGVAGNGTDVGTVTFAVPANAPNTLYYNCQFHAAMTGLLAITDAPPAEVVLGHFNLPGEVIFSTVPGATRYRVEWASAAGDTWTNFAAAATALDDLPGAGSGIITARVPMLYRVVAEVAQMPDLVITEIMYDPAVSSDTTGEWFELYNRGGQTVNLNGLTIESDPGQSHIINNGSPLLITPGAYLVLGSSTDPFVNGNTPVAYAYSGITLLNTADTIALRQGTNLIDAVSYDEAGSFPAVTGASIYLRNTALSAVQNDAGTNWAASVSTYGDGDLGTPGADNGP